MNIGGDARSPRRRIKRLRRIETEQSRHEPLAQTQLSLSGPKTFETKNGLLDAGRAQRDALFRQRDAKPIYALSREPARARDRACG